MRTAGRDRVFGCIDLCTAAEQAAEAAELAAQARAALIESLPVRCSSFTFSQREDRWSKQAPSEVELLAAEQHVLEVKFERCGHELVKRCVPLFRVVCRGLRSCA